MAIRRKTLPILYLIILSTCALANNDNRELYIESIITKATEYKYNYPDSLFHYANKAVHEANKINNKELKFKALKLLIDENIRSGKFLNALYLCDSANLLTINNNNSEFKANVLLVTGYAYSAFGLSDQALEYFFKALNYTNNKTSPRTRIDINYYIAVAYQHLHEYEECKFYLNNSLKLAIINNIYEDTFPIYMLYSSLFTELDSISKYIDLADEVLIKYPQLSYEKVALLNSQALIFDAIGDYSLSRSKYLEAINISLHNNYQDYLSNIFNNFSYLLMKQRKFDSANILINKAIKIAKEMKNSNLLASFNDTYSDYFMNINDFKNAFTYKDSSIYYRNKYREQQQLQRSQVLTVAFKTEQKEKEILKKEKQIGNMWVVILSVIALASVFIGLFIFFRQKWRLNRAKLETVEKGKALEIADALLKGQDSERKRLAMDLHDGLGARMSALRFMVDGNFRTNKKYKEVISFIETIHQNIRELSHRMLPSQLEDAGLTISIKSLVKSINDSGNFNVEFDTNLEERLSNKLEVNLYHIIFELVNNATKHSKGNSIVVQLILHDDEIQLSVEDNGGGMKIHSKDNSLGLKNVKTRVEYLGGTMVIDSDESLTIFMIEIPLSNHD